ncbi:hypothetical protein D3C85_1722680 [compost metagenome]
MRIDRLLRFKGIFQIALQLFLLEKLLSIEVFVTDFAVLNTIDQGQPLSAVYGF